MSLFGIREKEKLERAEKVIKRDKRFLQQYEDIESLHFYKKLVATFIATIILAFIIYFL